MNKPIFWRRKRGKCVRVFCVCLWIFQHLFKCINCICALVVLCSVNRKWIKSGFDVNCVIVKVEFGYCVMFYSQNNERKKIANAKWIWVVFTVKFNQIVNSNSSALESTRKIKKNLFLFWKYFNWFRHNEWRTPTLGFVCWIFFFCE